MKVPGWMTWNDHAAARMVLAVKGDFDEALLPVLADCLEEAGYVDAAQDNFLKHLRHESSGAMYHQSFKSCRALDELAESALLYFPGGVN